MAKEKETVETLHAQHGTPNTPTKEKAKRGEGVTITVDFKDHSDLLEKIKAEAKDDDREPSKWLRRRLIQLDEAGMLFSDLEQAETK